MLIETFTVGMLSTNCYVVSNQQSKEAVIIDPGLDFPSEAQQIYEYISDANLKVKFIVNTHGHEDHVAGNQLMQEKYNVPVCIHRLDAALIEAQRKIQYPSPVILEEGSAIQFGTEILKVLHTPGHTPGSICLTDERIAFTGDTLFAGGIGRTDFPGGSDTQMQASLEKLMRLPDYYLIYPGHGPTSIMGEEKRVNPFLNSTAAF
jgi:hydroxyacylglutathione hydrolase